VLRRPRLLLIPAIGAFTPVGLLVVDGSAFVMRNLAAFRILITVMALVSGVFLNSWVVYHVYDGFRRRWPQHLISRRESQEVVVVVALAGILIVSLLTAYLCYKGLENPSRLPNWETVVSAGIALLGPLVFSFIFSRRANYQGG
jgi:hypothetical protein